MENIVACCLAFVRIAISLMTICQSLIGNPTFLKKRIREGKMRGEATNITPEKYFPLPRVSSQIFSSFRMYENDVRLTPELEKSGSILTGCLVQWHRTGNRWSPVPTLSVAPLWCDLGFCSRTVVVIKLRRTSSRIEMGRSATP